MIPNFIQRNIIKNLVFLIIFIGLILSFWRSSEWTRLCAGLALFLFGMQCMEKGLQKLAGGKLEKILSKSTATPFKGLLFGMGATTLMQSTTLVSLLTIAFISAGLIGLSAGIAIILGVNLGATSGIWFLVAAGQNLSLASFALPMLVLGVWAGFLGKKGKYFGWIVLGIAFIFLGIDWIREGFQGFTGAFNFSAPKSEGVLTTYMFIGIGLVVTVILQSSHATLMLTLAALAAGQIDLPQSLALAIGSNVGSSIGTAAVGMLGGVRAGQRLALAHLIFNLVTAILALLLLRPLTWFVQFALANPLAQLALFHTIFNGLGVSVFWSLQKKFARFLERIWPDKVEPRVLIEQDQTGGRLKPIPHMRYLNQNALTTVDTGINAIRKETCFLERLSIEVVCHAIYIPVTHLSDEQSDHPALYAVPENIRLDADELYKHYIKGVYSDLLSFIGKIEASEPSQYNAIMRCQVTIIQLVDIVKTAKHLQKNLYRYISADDSPTKTLYLELRAQLFQSVAEIYQLRRSHLPKEEWSDQFAQIKLKAEQFNASFYSKLFTQVRSEEIGSFSMSSLINDLSYVVRIINGLCHVLEQTDDEEYTLFHDGSSEPAEFYTIGTS